MDPETPDTPPAEDETGSLAEHESQFTPGAEPPVEPETPEAEPPPAAATPTRDEHGRFQKPTRHRAQSQAARPEDVQRIAEYTKRLRAAEEASGIAQQPGESQRVYELRRRAELAEARREAAKPAPEPLPMRRSPPPAPPATFTETEPTFEEVAAKNPTHPDPYSLFQRQLSAYDRRKEAFEASQTEAETRAQQETQVRQQQFQQWVQARTAEHEGRLETYLMQHPEAVAELQAAAELEITPILYAAIQLHDQGPAMLRALAKQPAVLDEVYLLTDGKPVGDPYSNPTVAKVQRRLLQLVQAAQTGSAAPLRVSQPAPRPPNPVRTTPQSLTEALPGESGSLHDHEKAFGTMTRRRR